MPAAGISSWATCRLWNFIRAPPCHIHWDLKPEGKKQQTNKNQLTDDTNKTKPTTFQAHSLLIKQELKPTSGVAWTAFKTIQCWEIFLCSRSLLKHTAFMQVQTQSSRSIKESKSAYWLKQSPSNCTHLKWNRTALLTRAAPGAACSTARWAAVGARAPRRARGRRRYRCRGCRCHGDGLQTPRSRELQADGLEQESCFSFWQRVQPAR